MSGAVIEALRRLRLQQGRITRMLRSPALKALVCAHLLVAAIILARGNGWLQPFELLIYDTLRVAWGARTEQPNFFGRRHRGRHRRF